MNMIGRSVAPCAVAGRLLVNGLQLYNRPVPILHLCELLRFVSEGHALFSIGEQAENASRQRFGIPQPAQPHPHQETFR
jgi:hypothetical protein